MFHLDEAFTSNAVQNWAVRKDKIMVGYIKTMLSLLFATGTLKFENDASKTPSRVLLIGLGGAAIPNFLETLSLNVRFHFYFILSEFEHDNSKNN